MAKKFVTWESDGKQSFAKQTSSKATTVQSM